MVFLIFNPNSHCLELLEVDGRCPLWSCCVLSPGASRSSAHEERTPGSLGTKFNIAPYPARITPPDTRRRLNLLAQASVQTERGEMNSGH